MKSENAVVKVICWVFFAATVTYFFVLLKRPGIPTVRADILLIVVATLGAISVLTFGAASHIGTIIEKIGGQPLSENWVPRFFARVLGIALYHTIAAYGVVVGLLAGSWQLAVPFLALSLAGVVRSLVKADKLKKPRKR